MAIKTHTAKSLMALAMAEQKQIDALTRQIKKLTDPLVAQIDVHHATMAGLIEQSHERSHERSLAKKKTDWDLLLQTYPTSNAKTEAFNKAITDLGLNAIFWMDSNHRAGIQDAGRRI